MKGSLLLALLLVSGRVGPTRLTRFAKRRSAYFATLLARPTEYRLFGLVLLPDGVELLWRQLPVTR